MRTYKVVDVFTATPFQGNPVAVVLDADDLDTAQMQAIARWTNLSETTFLLKSTHADADYRLHIFTPRSELPFAGHPTLGSAHAALEAGRVTPHAGALIQECGAGLIRIAIDGAGASQRLTLDMPQASITPLAPEDVVELEAVLGQPVRRDAAPSRIDVGAVWIVAQLQDAQAVIDLTPDFTRSAALERRLKATGVSIFGVHAQGETDIEVRSFAPSCGVDEDPVCGSGNGSIAAFRALHQGQAGHETGYTASQGQCVGRNGRVSLDVAADGTVSVGGACVTCVDGTLIS